MPKPSETSDLYERLEITHEASIKEIKSAYYLVAKKWHPDYFPEKEKHMAHKEFLSIGEAYLTLSDSITRRLYDIEKKYKKVDETNLEDVNKIYEVFVNLTELLDEYIHGIGFFLRTPEITKTFVTMGLMMPKFVSIFGNFEVKPKNNPKQSNLENLLDKE